MAQNKKPDNDVYICADSNDAKPLRLFEARLQQSKITYYVRSPKLDELADLPRSISDRIENCRVFVFIFSKAANENEKLLWELDKATEFKKPFITFRIDGESPNDALAYYIGNTQWMDVKDGDVSSSFKELILVLYKVLDIDHITNADLEITLNGFRLDQFKKDALTDEPAYRYKMRSGRGTSKRRHLTRLEARKDRISWPLFMVILISIVIGVLFLKHNQVFLNYLRSEKDSKKLVPDEHFIDSVPERKAVVIKENHAFGGQSLSEKEIQHDEGKKMQENLNVRETEHPRVEPPDGLVVEEPRRGKNDEEQLAQLVSRPVIFDTSVVHTASAQKNFSHFLNELTIEERHDLYSALSGYLEEYQESSIPTCSVCRTASVGQFVLSVLDQKVYGPAEFERIRLGKKVWSFDPQKATFLVSKKDSMFEFFVRYEEPERVYYKNEKMISQTAIEDLDQSFSELAGHGGSNLASQLKLAKLIYFRPSKSLLPVYEQEGYQFYFLGRERQSASVAYVMYGEGMAKVNLDLRTILMSSNMSLLQLKTIEGILTSKRPILLQKWQAQFQNY